MDSHLLSMSSGWIASDATSHSLTDERPDWLSLVSAAIAVEDIAQFNQQYHDIMEQKLAQHGIKSRYPVIKSEEIDRWCSDWERKSVRKDIITDLLHIDCIDTIQIVETSLHSEWVDVFSGEADKKDRIRSEKFVERHLQPYYNLISIWEYLRKESSRPRTHKNVMTDDFSGKLSPAWIQIGEMADGLDVVPKGDRTYPLLSFADLLMEWIKVETSDWNEKNIYENVEAVTPRDSAYVDSDAIDEENQFEAVAPYKTTQINTSMHYPHPIFFIDTSGYGSNIIRSTDFFKHATRLAYLEGGCVKFIHENADRDYVTSEDYIICMDGNKNNYDYFTEFNDERIPTVINADEAKEIFSSELGAYS